MIFEKSRLTLSIIISITITLMASLSIRYVVSADSKSYVLSFVRSRPIAVNIDEVTTSLAIKSVTMNDSDLRTLSIEIEKKYSQAEVRSIFSNLLKYNSNKQAMTLGFYILENSANHYKLKNMLFYAGKFYREGRYTDKDFQKAKSFLSDITLKNDANALFELGLLYLDKTFVDYDAIKARAFFQAAADKGLASAQKKLLVLPAAQ